MAKLIEEQTLQSPQVLSTPSSIRQKAKNHEISHKRKNFLEDVKGENLRAIFMNTNNLSYPGNYEE
jgi:hypothetical protein